MKNLVQYETFHDYWQDVIETFAGSEYFRPVPKKHHQRELAVGVSGGLSIRLVALGPEPTSLQIRQSFEGGSYTTKLDVTRGYLGEFEKDICYLGHLVLNPSGQERVHGLTIRTADDIPRPTRQVIDENVEMLDNVFNHWLTKP